MKKKIVALCLVVALLAIAIVGGTMAYFTDTEAQTNVFTLGEIKIDLYENFNPNGENLLPAVATSNGFENAITKEVNVENEGKNNAYVRVHIAIPALTTNYDVIALEHSSTDWTFAQAPYATMIGNVLYSVHVATYNTELEPGDKALNAIDAVHMNPAVTQTDVAGWNEQYGEGEWAKVYVYAEGVQADGFNSAAEALNTAFGTPGTYGVTWTTATNVANEAQLLAAMNNAAANVTLTKDINTTGNIVLAGGTLDGNGETITKVNNSSSTNAGVAPTGGTIRNITITGDAINGANFRAVYATSGLTSNLYIDGATLEGGYAINVNGASTGSLIVDDSILMGWVSYSQMPGARFSDCQFAATGTTADGFAKNTFRPYADTVLTDCSFLPSYNFSAGVADLVIELNECKIDDGSQNGVAITAANFATLFNVDTTLTQCSVIVDGVKVVFN